MENEFLGKLMPAPDSNSEKKASSHAEKNLQVCRVWSGVPRSDLRQAALYSEWLEPCQRPETLAEVCLPWPILRSMPAKACAHVYGQRTDSFRAWAFIAAVVPSSFLRTEKLNGMAEDTAAANRASNGVGTDSRRIRLVQLLGLHHEAAVG
jgi:hypothetical protein